MNDSFNEVFSKRLRFYMECFSMNQRDLAERMDVSEACVAYWIKGLKVPRADKVDKLCVIFHCNRSDLVEEPSEETNPQLQKHMSIYSQLNTENQQLVDDITAILQSEGEDSDKALKVIQMISTNYNP